MNNFVITESAAKRIRFIQDQANLKLSKDDKPKKALRISVDGGGCSGFMYNYNLESEISENDMVVAGPGDIASVVIDDISMDFLKGCVLDFIEELGGAYFDIKNPNATGKCGCGSSFAI